jgi:hypothetical protein
MAASTGSMRLFRCLWQQEKLSMFALLLTGENSTDILSWFVDNIHVWADCRAPLDLSGVQVPGGHISAYLEWAEPDCETGASGTLVKLSQWDGAPTNAYFQSYNMGLRCCLQPQLLSGCYA